MATRDFAADEERGRPIQRITPIKLHVAPTYATLPEMLAMTAPAIDAVYVHVPFCSTKCHYCDFYSLAGHLEESGGYLQALRRELELQRVFFTGRGRSGATGDSLGRGIRPRTVFIGGGTPTLLPPPQLAELLALLHEHLDLAAVEEFTVEANPNTFDPAKAAVLREFGVNRISFGAQSFVPAELRMLQRDHDPESIAPAFATARAAGITNLNLDLIFGIPGQTAESWEYSLARALEQSPAHMSCYSLTYEPSTAMTARLGRGEFSPIDESTELAMFEHVYARLRDAGFERYETSNYARVGGNPEAPAGTAAVCRHNLTYWKGGNWLGFGPSAGAHVALPAVGDEGRDGKGPADHVVAWQWKNVGSLAHYLEALGGADVRMRWPISQLEAQGRAAWAGGVAVFWLRLAEGLAYAEFSERTGIDPREPLRRALGRYVELGLVECEAERARILEPGVAVSNRILVDVLAAFERQAGGK